MSKHTPGPWLAYRAKSGTWRDEVRAPAGTAYRTVALLRSLEYTRGDARLIAAAPELLEAAKWADRMLRLAYSQKASSAIRGMEGSLPDFKKLQDAIAKAEGEP